MWAPDANKMECLYEEMQVTVKGRLQVEPCSAKVIAPARQWFYLLTSSDIFQGSCAEWIAQLSITALFDACKSEIAEGPVSLRFHLLPGIARKAVKCI